MSKITLADEIKANEELKKFVSTKNSSKNPSKNSQHFKRCLEVSRKSRRDYIENKAENIKDILKEYPILADYDMVRSLGYFKNFYILIEDL